MAESLCACARWLKSPVRLCTKSSMFDDVGCARLCLTLPGWLLRLCLMQPACRTLTYEALLLLPSCDATGMSYACVQGLIVVAIVRRDWHVVRSRTRPYRRCPSGNATGMSYACVRGLIVVACLATRPACRTLAYKALSLSQSCDANGMSYACV